MLPISAAVAGRLSSPIAAARTAPWPTKHARLIAIGRLSQKALPGLKSVAIATIAPASTNARPGGIGRPSVRAAAGRRTAVTSLAASERTPSGPVSVCGGGGAVDGCDYRPTSGSVSAGARAELSAVLSARAGAWRPGPARAPCPGAARASR